VLYTRTELSRQETAKSFPRGSYLTSTTPRQLSLNPNRASSSSYKPSTPIPNTSTLSSTNPTAT
jgi:hypothetical protein